MSDKKSKTGPKPKPPGELKSTIKAVRMNDYMVSKLESIADELKLADSDLIRVGTIMLLKDIEDNKIDLGDLYRYAATT